MTHLSALSFWRRFAGVFSSWVLLTLASPGILTPEGVLLIAAVALVPWALCASRPGPRAFLGEWLASGLGLALLCAWNAYVWVGTLVFLAIVPSIYVALAGVLLRRIGPRVSLAVTVPACWVFGELLRFLLEPPFGFGWMRHGVCAHDFEPLAASARVWGVFGLSFVLAGLSGGIAAAWRARAARPLVFGVVPSALALVLGWISPPPSSEPGPELLLVQPAFEQERKMERRSAQDLFRASCELTREGLAEVQRAGHGAPDLVAWGETMLPLPILEKGLAEEARQGARIPEWTGSSFRVEDIPDLERLEQQWIVQALFGGRNGRGLLPEGTSFLSGCELYVSRGDEIRRANGIVLWGADGARRGSGGKVVLVPGAEHLCGLERYAWVRNAAYAVAGYTPDLVAFERASVVELETRDQRSYRIALSVCFDNAFDQAYTKPLREEPVDFHLVCSNEAWFETSCELDQMVAFSRLVAISTGRSVVRATNSGVTMVLGPDGREVERLVESVRGRPVDRMLAGTLWARVPVPTAGEAGSRTPYVRFEHLWHALGFFLPLLLVLLARRRVTAPTGRASGPSEGPGDMA